MTLKILFQAWDRQKNVAELMLMYYQGTNVV